MRLFNLNKRMLHAAPAAGKAGWGACIKHALHNAAILVFFFGYGGTAAYAKTLQKGDAYYKRCFAANTAIAKGDYRTAINIFSGLQKQGYQLFFLDLNNWFYAEVMQDSANGARLKPLLLAIEKQGVCVHKRVKSVKVYQVLNPVITQMPCMEPAHNSPIKRQIDSMLAGDQGVRSYAEKKYGNPYKPAVYDTMSRTDGQNYQLIGRILATNGVDEAMLGYDPFNSLMNMLDHNAQWGRQYLNAQVIKLVQQGRFDGREVGAYLDRQCLADRLRVDDPQPLEPCHEFFARYGTGVLTLFSKIAIFCEVNEPGLYNSLMANRAKLYLQDIYQEARIMAYAFYYRNDGFLYTDVGRFPNDKYGQDYAENLRKQGKRKFIQYTSKDDFDFNRNW